MQLLTVVALAYGALLEGAVLIETVFMAGVWLLPYRKLAAGRYECGDGLRAAGGVIFVMLNLLSDMLYQFFDPRTKS